MNCQGRALQNLSTSVMLCFFEFRSMANLNSLNLILFFLYFSSAVAGSGFVGVNYGRIADNLPEPTKVVQLLKTQGLTRVKIYDTDAGVLSALAGSGISAMVCLPNENLSSAAAGQSFTDTWIQTNILPYKSTQIEAIAVGNEVFADPHNTTGFLVPAMKNLYSSLQKYGLDKSIKISSPIALSALQNSYPSSAGSFKQELRGPVITPMLDFLRQTGSYLMVNVYPFFAYTANPSEIPLDYALFRASKAVVDPGNGLQYYSLFDAQVDAVLAAMNAVNYGDVKIVVTETGWPSKGGESETGASADNAAAYNGNLVKRVLTGRGTPLRPNDPINVYIFALFNEDQKTGEVSEKNYGLFYPDEERVYNIPLTLEQLNGGQQTPINGSKSEVKAPAPSSGGGAVGETWCVANGQAGEQKLQNALDYACGQGGADCRPIQPGATCYNPNTLEAHASYAFNSYYQKNARSSGTCNFGGTAYVVTQPPKYGNCEFPTGY
ncbi:Glucan endo-1,3-beta-D-glucosidase [Bertholletia excelsa]